MTSMIDISKPINRTPSIKSIRDNFIAVYNEHEYLNDNLNTFKNNIKDPFNYNPIGFNYYSILYEKLLNYNNANVARNELLQYAKNCGCDLIRIMLPCFNDQEYLSLVHNTSSIPLEATDQNLRSTFVTNFDLIMNDLANYGLKVSACWLWTQYAIPTAFGETTAYAYNNTSSKTITYSLSLLRWFTNRYKNHPAFGIISIGNEWRRDSTGVNYPTPQALGDFFSMCSSVIKEIRPETLVTTDIELPTSSVSATRPTMDDWITEAQVMFKDLDIICVHLYGDGYNYNGYTAVGDSASFSNSNTNTLGYEGVKSLLSTVKSFCISQNKPFMMGEFGVSSNNESDLNNTKKKYFTNLIASYADCSLIWNLQDTTLANGISNQIAWFIDSSSDRANTWLPIIQNINKSKPILPYFGGGSISLRESLKPKYLIKSTRLANNLIRLTSTAKHQSTTGYSLMFWIKYNDFLNAFEPIIDLRNSTTAGIMVLGNPNASNTSLYMDGRSSSGSVGNTNGYSTSFGKDNIVHVAIGYMKLNNIFAYQIWINGLYWNTGLATKLPDSIPVGTNFMIMGQSNGVPLEMQDIALLPYFNNEDVWKHMKGDILPQSLFHIRGMSNGKIYDVSNNPSVLTIGSQIIVQAS